MLPDMQKRSSPPLPPPVDPTAQVNPSVADPLCQNGEIAALRAEVARLHGLLDEAGHAAEHGMVLLAQADAEHLRIEACLQRSRDDLRILTETIPQLVWRSGCEGCWTWGSPQWSAYTGQSDPDSRGSGWLDIVHPDDRDRTVQAWHAAEAQYGLDVEHRLRRARDGAYRWFQTRATPLRDVTGQAVEWFGTSTEVHALKELQAHEARLRIELQRRVRNTLSVVRTLVRRTVGASVDVEGYAMHLDGRLNAFSRIQSALTRDPDARIGLESLVSDELRAVLAREGERTRIAGPSVLLQHQAAETLALAVHELTTNALKFGALRHARGRIAVTWQVEGTGAQAQLTFAWIETGVPNLAAAPGRRGFGMNLLERVLPHKLRAITTLRFTAEGLSCRIVMPLAGLIADDT